MVYFEEKVRPLLVQHCYECHAAESKTLQGSLLLDSKEGWTRGGDSGPAVVPGKPEESLLVRAIGYTDENVQMPPAGKLAAREIEILTNWVKIGAPDPRTGPAKARPKRVVNLVEERKHWAYQPLAKVAPPEVNDSTWCRTPIDRFILAKLEEHQLLPNPIVDPRRLIRRAYFDLIGLPPSPEEVEEFVRACSPSNVERESGRGGEWEKAYAALIDRLLESPHYGERWGRHWLDLARFGESHGFEQDYDRPNAYHYRDFVIKALNQDLPYDTFVKWQLAGDEYAPDNPLAMAATGFLAAGVHATQITANQAEKERYDELDDITRTIGTTMLGLTIGCARCHDHKFDPIPNEDYYRMVSTFTTTVRSDYDVSLDPTGDRLRREAYDREHAPLVAALKKFESEEVPKQFDSWIKSEDRIRWRPDWTVLQLNTTKTSGTKFVPQSDNSLLAEGTNPAREFIELSTKLKTTRIATLRLEFLEDVSLPAGGPGRSDKGGFTLHELRVNYKADPKANATELKLVNTRLTNADAKSSVAQAFDRDNKTAWTVDAAVVGGVTALVDLEKPLEVAGGSELIISLAENGQSNGVGRLRVSITEKNESVNADSGEVLQQALPVLEKLINDPATKLDDNERKLALGWFAANDKDWKTLEHKVREHARTFPRPKTVKMLISSEGVPAVRLHTQGPDFYDKTFFLTRGDPNAKKDEATPGYLQVLMSSPEREQHWLKSPPSGARTTYRRHAMAEWLTDTQQGAGQLVARVMANRLWHYHLGRGIVATPSDFGTQGARPTHPELLDWLSQELLKNGWRLKPLHKLIMTSAVYMQSAAVDAERLKIDHENTWFWRRPVERLEAEVIRDAMLAASGELDRTQFGPGTLDPNHKRRSIYFFVKRSKLVPMMVLFDAPDPLQDMAQRQTTTIAPQALMLLNSTTIRSYAEAFAKRLAPTSPGDTERVIDQAYRITLARSPSPDELRDAREFIGEQTKTYAASGKSDARQLALADFCQVLFGLNEFVYVD